MTIIILKPQKFYSPKNYRWEIYDNTSAENGDYTIEIPSLDFGEECYASLNVVGRHMHDDEGLHFGYVELVDLKVICKRGIPLYHGLPEPKKYEYIMSLYLYDVDRNWQTYELHGTDISFLLYTILPLINLVLRDGYLISQINFDWLEWQCNAWESGEANGQGRGFLFNNEDIYSLEQLYKYIKSFKIEAIKQSLCRRGGGIYWTDVCISFRYIDKYVSKLISDALGVNFIISGDTAKEVSYKFQLDKFECDGYCPNNSSLLSNNEVEKYKDQIEMKLMIHVLRAFDLLELKKSRLIK